MIVSIGGELGSGKSTVAKLLAKELGATHHSIGDLMRQLAKEQHMSIMELTEVAKTDNGKTDEILDDRLRSLAKHEGNIVVDARLGWHFLPESFKVFLDVHIDEAAKRIHGAKRADEAENHTVEHTKANIQKRQASEHHRYKELYGINHTDHQNFDLVVDTTDKSPEAVVQTIIEALQE